MYVNSVEFDVSQPEKPTDNTMIEAMGVRLREECLPESRLFSLEAAKENIRGFRPFYNLERSHGALGNLAPAAIALPASAGAQ